MQFDIVTIFPDFFTGPLDYGIVRRAREARLMDVSVHDLRAFTMIAIAPWTTVRSAAAKAWS